MKIDEDIAFKSWWDSIPDSGIYTNEVLAYEAWNMARTIYESEIIRLHEIIIKLEKYDK
jgi:hypothetical protein